METIFIQLLNASITASYIVIAVILLRFVLMKASKWISCLLWMVVGIRLLIPISFESVFSLIPSAKPVPDDIAISQEPAINTGVDILNNSINPIITENFKPNPTASANPLQPILTIVTVIWLVGAIAMLLWGLISYIRLRIKVSPSIKLRDNIYICDNIDSPFILGILRPRIYLPSSICECDTDIVLRHEKAHISRLDHIWKPISFVLLAVYWFNPLMWVAYILLCRDIEAACDQKVIAAMTDEDVRQYSRALLSYSTSSVKISACPLAFGEVGVKSRIKSILNYKKPAFWVIIVSMVLLVGIAVGFLTNPITDKSEETSSTAGNDEPITPKYGETDTQKLTDEQKDLMAEYPEFFGLDYSRGLDVYVECSGSFTCILRERPDDKLTGFELINAHGVYDYKMRQILKTYDISPSDVNIIPYQSPLSSSISQYFTVWDGQPKQYKEAFIYNIQLLLFDDAYATTEAYYDTYIADIDSDGIAEICSLGYGTTSGLWSFTISAREVGDTEPEYSSIIIPDTKFSQVCFDYNLNDISIRGYEKDASLWHKFDVTFKDSEITLYQNGTEVDHFVGGTVITPLE